MRILIVGAGGTIGRAVVAALKGRHELVLASMREAPEQVDISNPASIRSLYARVGRVDAVVSTAGPAAFKPLAELSDADFAFSLSNKLMGQVNLVRFGVDSVADAGSFTITAGCWLGSPRERQRPSAWSTRGWRVLDARPHSSCHGASASMSSARRGYPRRCARWGWIRVPDYLPPMWRALTWRVWKGSKRALCSIPACRTASAAAPRHTASDVPSGAPSPPPEPNRTS